MPGLTGLELAQVLVPLQRRRRRSCSSRPTTSTPSTRSSCNVVDYVLKPVRDDRLAEAVRRVVRRRAAGPAPRRTTPSRSSSAGVTRFVRRCRVRYVEAQGDYARLHTADGQPPDPRRRSTTLEEEWRDAGFVRIHRSHLVSLAHVAEVRMDGGRCTVMVDGEELQVSRRHTARAARPARPPGAARRRGAHVTEPTPRASASPARAPTRARPRRRRRHLGDRRSRPARRDLHVVAAAHPAAPRAAWCCFALGVLVGGLPLLFAAGARRCRTRGCRRHAAAVGAARLRASTRCCSVLGWVYVRGPSATSATSPRWSTGVTSPSGLGSSSRCCWSRWRRWRSAPTAGGSRAPRATSSWRRARSGPP